jgi:hypothetical protein
MPDADFERRLARLHQSRDLRAAPDHIPNRSAGPARNYRERLERALAVAAASGISRHSCFPPMLKALSALGLPVRPWHFQSLPSLFFLGFCIGLSIFGGILWLFTSDLIPVSPTRAIRRLVEHGWSGVVFASLFMGIVNAALYRVQARRARLPRWRDL